MFAYLVKYATIDKCKYTMHFAVGE